MARVVIPITSIRFAVALVGICVALVSTGIVVPPTTISQAIGLVIYLRAGRSIRIAVIVPPITAILLASGPVSPSIAAVLSREFSQKQE